MCFWDTRPGRGTAASQTGGSSPRYKRRESPSGWRAVIPGCSWLPARIGIRSVSKVLHLFAASVTPGLFQLQNLWGSTCLLGSGALLLSPFPGKPNRRVSCGWFLGHSVLPLPETLHCAACSRLSFLEQLGWPLARATRTGDPQGKGCKSPNNPFSEYLPPVCLQS